MGPPSRGFQRPRCPGAVNHVYGKALPSNPGGRRRQIKNDNVASRFMDDLKAGHCFFLSLKTDGSYGTCGNRSPGLKSKKKISQHLPNAHGKSRARSCPVISECGVQRGSLCPATDTKRWTSVRSFNSCFQGGCHMPGTAPGSENKHLEEGFRVRGTPNSE